MPRFAVPAMGLQFHAALISSSLLVLTFLLGVKAYVGARGHFGELSALVEHDSKAQALLARIDTTVLSRDNTRKKLRITRDQAYESLISRQDEALQLAAQALEVELGVLYPDLLGRALTIEKSQDVEALRELVGSRRQDRLQHAHDAALKLARLVAAAFLLSIGATAWLLHLFYRQLIDPLRALKEATDRIRSGELSCRAPSSPGVRELIELTQSFNSMAERLESLDRAKAEFLALVSHEIKNPLAALKEGMSLLARRSHDISEDAKVRAFAACTIASKRLEAMINNLLGHSRMEAGLYQFDMSLKDLGEAIHTVIQEVGPLARRRKMEISYSGPKSIPASFNWDGMVQVFENLLLNAIKYGDEGSAIEIMAQDRQLPDERLAQLELTVANRGKSIAEADLDRIFERFYRGSHTSSQGGLGLGLHVVRRVVEAHHGVVSAVSQNGRTAINVTIPRQYESGTGYRGVEQ